MNFKKFISCLVACGMIFESSVTAMADANSDQIYATAYQSVSRAKESLDQSSINNARKDIYKLKGTESEDKIVNLTKELDKIQNELFDNIIKIIKNDNRTQKDLDNAFYYLKDMKDTPELSQYYNEWQGMINNIQEIRIKECREMLETLRKKSNEEMRLKLRDCLLDLITMSPRSDIENLYFCKVGELKDQYVEAFGEDKLYGREEFKIVNCIKDTSSITITFNRKFPESLVSFPFQIRIITQKNDRESDESIDKENFKIEKKDRNTLVLTPNNKEILKGIKGIRVNTIETFRYGKGFGDTRDFQYLTDYRFR